MVSQHMLPSESDQRPQAAREHVVLCQLSLSLSHLFLCYWPWMDNHTIYLNGSATAVIQLELFLLLAR